MKFTNGFWLVRDEFQADYVRDIYEVEERKTNFLAFGSNKQIQDAGMIFKHWNDDLYLHRTSKGHFGNPHGKSRWKLRKRPII